MKKIISGLILMFFCLSVGLGAYVWNFYLNQPNQGPNEEVLFEVHQGESFFLVVKSLEQMGLVRNAQIFSIYAKLKGEAGKMKVGEYAIRKNMYPSEVLAIINSGKSIGRSLTFPEGISIYEIGEMLEEDGFASKDDFLATVKDPELIQSLLGEKVETLEGYLFPETYQVTKFTSLKQLVSVMVKKFLIVWGDLEAIAKNSGMTRHQIVTLASIVEKETGAPEERPIISSVFHNRIKKGMRLQTDPTVIYGKAETSKSIVIDIRRADLTQPTRYNTYTINGLPPGPIANPSREALVAAIEPATSEYLYFVSKNQGTHTFSKDYGGHLEAVKKFQLDPKARAGKSWRDQKKTTSTTNK